MAVAPCQVSKWVSLLHLFRRARKRWLWYMGARHDGAMANMEVRSDSEPETSPPVGINPIDEKAAQQLESKRVVTLFGEVDDELCRRVAMQILLLADRDPQAPIVLLVDSPGGSVFAGMIVYDAIQLVPCPVHTVALGFAASMGQFLVTAGEPGHRLAIPHARMLIHQPSAGIGGSSIDIGIQAEQHRRSKQELFHLQARHIGKSVEQIERDSDRDRWFFAPEAVDYGLVDGLVERWSELIGS